MPLQTAKTGDLTVDHNFLLLTQAVTAAPEPVHLIGATGEPAFQNSWANFGGGFEVAGFYKHHNRVYLQGVIDGGGTGTTIFTLPAGYRPALTSMQDILTHTGAANAVGRIDIPNTGAVTAAVIGAGFVSLEGISFRVA